ncbi:MAG TPA: serine hydrolase domain-containing protein [Lacibacter sp.]|nr:serine hydrolase domain-containing protein [Lacibacter sp.]
MRKIFLTFLISLLTICSYAQPDAKLIKKLDTLFSSFNKATPGAAVTVMQNGKILAKRSYGLASLEHKVPFKHNSVVRFGYSEGREFMVIAAVLMENAGILKLSDKIRNYFPQLPSWTADVDILDIINHRSGLADEWDAFLLMQASMGNRVDVSQFLQMLYDQPVPEVEPRKGYMYSNSDYGLLRLIMEKASGEDLGTWMKKNMFDPLKMYSTLLHSDKEEMIMNRAYNYERLRNEKYVVDMNEKTSPGGNYHIATCANDLEQWAAAHADKNSAIAKAVQRLMTNATLIPSFNKAYKHYTFGITIKEENGFTTIAHEGVNSYTYLSYIPSKSIAVILVSNGEPIYENYHKAIHQFLLKTSEKPFVNKKFMPSSVSYSPEELKAFTGRYIDEDTVAWESHTRQEKNIVNYIIENDSLKVKQDGGSIIPLEYISKNVFKAVGFDAYFEFLPTTNGFILKTHVYPALKVYTHIKADIVAWKPSKDLLASFAGKYYSKHLDYYWTIIEDGEGNLVIKRPTIADTKIIPERENSFLIRIEEYAYREAPTTGWIRFYTDSSGVVTHLTVSHPRLMHHRFDKVK